MITKKAVVAIVFLISEENHRKFYIYIYIYFIYIYIYIIFLVGSSFVPVFWHLNSLIRTTIYEIQSLVINVSRLLYVIVTLQNLREVFKKEANRHRLVIGRMILESSIDISYHLLICNEVVPNFQS